jgi:hypothetical protein
VGVKNDQDYVYLRLLTTEEQFRRQAMKGGLTVWFESEDGKKLGILYPMGIFNRSETPPFPNPEATSDPEERNRLNQQALRDVELLGPGKNDRNLFTILELPGITVKVENSRGSAVYDLQVPLRESDDHPYALAARAGSTINLKIETGKNESGPRSGGLPGGGRSGVGRMGGGSHGGGKSGGENGGSRPEPLEFSAKFRLAGQSVNQWSDLKVRPSGQT